MLTEPLAGAAFTTEEEEHAELQLRERVAGAEAEADSELRELQEAVDDARRRGLPSVREAQELLGELLTLLPEVRRSGDPHLAAAAHDAAASVLVDPPQVALARLLVRSLRNRFFQSPALRVIQGVIAFSAIFVTLAALVPQDVVGRGSGLGIESGAFPALVAAGAVGSLVSLLTRLHDYSGREYTTRGVLVFESFLRPFVGIAFALFLYAVITSNIVQIITAPRVPT